MADDLIIVRHAVENASVLPVTRADIVRALAGGGGHPSHVRAIFSDVPLPALARAGAAAGIDLGTILDAYRAARTSVAAANAELDQALAEPW